MSRIARKSSCDKDFTPGKTAKLSLNHTFTPEQFAEVKKGVIAKEMEDKWTVYYEHGSIYFHRSWTGFLIYKVSLVPDSDGGATAKDFEVNTDPEQYTPDLIPWTGETMSEEQKLLASVSFEVSVLGQDNQPEIPEVGRLMELISWISQPGEKLSFLGAINKQLRMDEPNNMKESENMEETDKKRKCVCL